MYKTVSRFGCMLLLVSVPLRSDVQVVQDETTPSRIRPQIVILSSDWIKEIPPTKRVNAPEFLKSLYSGQKLALAILAEGPDRDRLLDGARIGVQINTLDHGVFRDSDLKPLALRQIKAEGADAAMIVLNAGGISQKDQGVLEKAMSGVTFAVFEPDWTAPLVDREEEVQITATIEGIQSKPTLEPIHVKIRPTAAWLKESPDSIEDVGTYLNRYHEDLPPGHLLSLLKTVSDKGALNSPSVLSFFAIAFRERTEARNAAITIFPTLDRKTQLALAVVFRFAGLDVSEFLPKLPAEAVTSLKMVEPLKDPRKSMDYRDPVTADIAKGIGTTMDECWGGWMATGEQSYLRALVGLLSGAPDYPIFEDWVRTRGGVKGLNAHVAKGLAYQTAGWSIGAFQRVDPHVADWLLYWENDPNFPALLRKELDSLPGNPAFRRN